MCISLFRGTLKLLAPEPEKMAPEPKNMALEPKNMSPEPFLEPKSWSQKIYIR